MKVVILAGGLGTRLSEETSHRPKPMVTINDTPILEKIMGVYANQGFQDFIVLTGYRSEIIDQWFSERATCSKSFVCESEAGTLNGITYQHTNKWVITTLDTGLHANTAERIHKLLQSNLVNEPFFLTYGDGLANVNLNEEVDFFRNQGCLAVVTVVHPAARFGSVNLNGNLVKEFHEKDQSLSGWINGGFFILHPEIVNYFTGEEISFEETVLPRIARDQNLAAYQHEGFWKPMDTLREKFELEVLDLLPLRPWEHIS